VEISARYAWMYQLQPACFKWAAMAAIASHHVRLALFPLRLDTDRTGYVDIPHSLRRHKLLLTEDVNTIRATNNAIRRRPGLASQARKSWVPPPEPVRITTRRRRRRGIWASASRVTSMCSAAVFDPAFPGRSKITGA
jgi:hypothetical protein